MNIFPVNALRDNYIWMLTEGSSVWAVDPGEAQPVLDFLEKEQLSLQGILVTHHHADHTAGIPELLARYPGMAVYASEQSAVHAVTRRFVDGETFLCGSVPFRALAIPGHTLDHMAWLAEGALFAGDTLFSAGCGRIFEGTVEMMYASLQKLMALPPDTRLYCGHEYTLANLNFAAMLEPYNVSLLTLIKQLLLKSRQGHRCTLPSTLRTEKEINPFLRCTAHTIIEKAQSHAKKKLTTPQQVFGTLREWKNHFVASPGGEQV
jgi:hydroxyacylglutathione hydrolase